MLIADRRGAVRVRYEVHDTATGPDAVPPVELALHRWDRSAEFDLDGVRYAVELKRRFLMGHEGRLFARDREIARAEGMGTSDWELESDDGRYRFVRPNPLTRTQQQVEAGNPVGTVRRLALGFGAEADLPALPPHLRLFVLGALLLVWEEETS